ncbi:CubicO group peptidase, beta-lactamase class C family [Aquiflexum balticum DSM 16537]|uniref:CubicO group peptidase, beta-lactamase class C family n=1 Tax=Aquiflexum balticum DSM 16537 TaxID=758820 RepID=A0A1W2H117_9BACT|nr:serine hydrolase domain-containing protein [Aquiflexum balticum]SMD42630.1 CubicO group peptidase, beta-lactamase class C family [Aquiflexum balticum DSM 16537]
MKKLLTIVLISFIAVAVKAQSFDREKLDTYFETLASNNKLMGSITMANDGKIIYQKAFGYANIDQQIPLSSDSRFRVGSITKMFTAALIFKAIEEGKIQLDQTIDGFFPELKNSEKISISQLMNHRSGIHSFTSDPDYLSWNTTPKSRKSLYTIIIEGGSDFEPGTKADYSNSNYVLLTWILEDVYKEDYADLLSKNITGPLGLENTYLGKKTSTADNEAFSYKFTDKWVKEADTDMSIPLGAGAIVSTTEDLTKFIEGLFAGKIISQSSLNLMQEMKDNFGRGLFKIPFYDKLSYGHTGGIDEFKSMLSYFPEEKFSFAMSVNGGTFDPNQAAIAALSAYFGKDYGIPVFKNITLTTEELERYLGIYSSPSFPLKITISKENNTLVGQATGQPSFVLEAEGNHTFSFSRAGLTLEFNLETEEMTLKQGGGIFVLQKE